IRGVRLALPGGGNNRLKVEMASGRIPKANVSAPSLRVTADDVRLETVTAEYDPNQRQIGGISARVRLGGLVESNRIQRELQNVQFLRGLNTGTDRVTFDLDLRASGPDVTPIVSEQFPAGKKAVSVNAAVALQPRDCTASYALATRVITRPLRL